MVCYRAKNESQGLGLDKLKGSEDVLVCLPVFLTRLTCEFQQATAVGGWDKSTSTRREVTGEMRLARPLPMLCCRAGKTLRIGLGAMEEEVRICS